MVGRSTLKFTLILVILLVITIPTARSNQSPSLVKSYQDSHISDLMPSASMSLHILDKNGRSVIQTTSDFDFSTAWHNGEEETGLRFGFDLQALGSGINRIEFDTVIFHWWAYSYTGDVIFDTTREQSFYLSQTTVGWGHEGTHLTTGDMNVVSNVGASMEIVDLTLYSFYNTVVCDSESLIFGVDFTRQEQTWSSSTFSIISSVYTADVSSVTYNLAEALQTPIWFDVLPYIAVLGIVGISMLSIRICIRESRRPYPPESSSTS